jgi:hypothetical protein
MVAVRNEIAARIQPFAARMVDGITNMLTAKLEADVAKIADSLDMMFSNFEASLNHQAQPPQARLPKIAQRALKGNSLDSIKDPKTRQGVGSCGNCGAVGFKRKTCGITHDKNGALDVRASGRAGATPKRPRVAADDDDDEEPAPIRPPPPLPVRVVANPPPAPKAHPSGPGLPKVTITRSGYDPSLGRAVKDPTLEPKLTPRPAPAAPPVRQSSNIADLATLKKSSFTPSPLNEDRPAVAIAPPRTTPSMPTRKLRPKEQHEKNSREAAIRRIAMKQQAQKEKDERLAQPKGEVSLEDDDLEMLPMSENEAASIGMATADFD